MIECSTKLRHFTTNNNNMVIHDIPKTFEKGINERWQKVKVLLFGGDTVRMREIRDGFREGGHDVITQSPEEFDIKKLETLGRGYDVVYIIDDIGILEHVDVPEPTQKEPVPGVFVAEPIVADPTLDEVEEIQVPGIVEGAPVVEVNNDNQSEDEIRQDGLTQ